MQTRTILFILMLFFVTPLLLAAEDYVGFIDTVNGLPADFELIRNEEELPVAPFKTLRDWALEAYQHVAEIAPEYYPAFLVKQELKDGIFPSKSSTIKSPQKKFEPPLLTPSDKYDEDKDDEKLQLTNENELLKLAEEDRELSRKPSFLKKLGFLIFINRCEFTHLLTLSFLLQARNV